MAGREPGAGRAREGLLLLGSAVALAAAAMQFVQVGWPALVTGATVLLVGWMSLGRRSGDRATGAGATTEAASAPVDPAPSTIHAPPDPPDLAIPATPLPAPPKRPRDTFGRRPPEAVASEAHVEPAFTVTPLPDNPAPVPQPSPEGRGKRGRSARWVPPGEPVEIQGLTVTGGLIYVGEKLGSDPWRRENCLIDPALPVAKAGRGSATGLTYWCRYDGLNPAGRRAYLDWLAGGRSDPAASIALVFLYFYGLEYRLFKEGVAADAPVLVAEVERLRAIYGANSSFQAYARSFVEAARLLVPAAEERRPELNLDPNFYSYELPLAVRVHLGRKLADGEPLDADDALLWLAGLPDRGFRTPVTRCPDEFAALWRLRFPAKYPKGLKVGAPKARIKASYRAASSTFQVDLKAPGSLPDIAAVSAPVRKLRELVEACTDELDAFSRFVGRRPDARGSVQAALLLPPDLACAGDAWTAVGERCEALFAAGAAMPATSLRRLLEVMEIPLPEEGRVPQAGVTQLCQALDRVGIGIEPDRRYGPEPRAGASASDADAAVVLFKGAAGAPVDATRPEYLALRGVIEAACLAAASDGAVSQGAADGMLAAIRGTDTLSLAEKSRLTAYALSIHRNPPKPQGILRRLAGRPLSERQACARAALAAVMAGGQAKPAEVRFLERLHAFLALPADGIYAALHRGPLGSAASAEPRGAEGSQPRGDVGDRASGRVVIDASRLERVRRETQAVASLLSDIFVEDSAPGSGAGPVSPPGGVAPEAPAPAPADTGPAGLDPAHAGLLAAVAASPDPMPREAFDRAARANGLFPDGALETINEWGFERFDEALIEHDDPVTIAAHLRLHLLPSTTA